MLIDFLERSVFIIIVLIRLTINSEAQVKADQPVRIMFYNAENFFDTFDDTLRDDNDFLPGGLMRWNLTRYTNKISSVYRTIVAAGEWEPPAIVAFCEIENRKVLEDLTNRTYLSKYNYGIIHEESPDPRGIDVCLIYRKDLVKVVDYKYWIPDIRGKGEFSSRSVLYTEFVTHGDTIHLIVNHWPSRRGGVLAREDSRLDIADMVRNRADSVYKTHSSGAKILIVGDFNCTPDDREIQRLLLTCQGCNELIDLSAAMAMDGSGTYRYQGNWEMIDQVIANEALLKPLVGLSTGEKLVKVFNPGFLLVKDPIYPGYQPYSTYRGYKYQGGFSDHLPVLIDLVEK